eukprot:366109-Chlamydomonas_euryale.AAC.5
MLCASRPCSTTPMPMQHNAHAHAAQRPCPYSTAPMPMQHNAPATKHNEAASFMRKLPAALVPQYLYLSTAALASWSGLGFKKTRAWLLA